MRSALGGRELRSTACEVDLPWDDDPHLVLATEARRRRLDGEGHRAVREVEARRPLERARRQQGLATVDHDRNRDRHAPPCDLRSCGWGDAGVERVERVHRKIAARARHRRRRRMRWCVGGTARACACEKRKEKRRQGADSHGSVGPRATAPVPAKVGRLARACIAPPRYCPDRRRLDRSPRRPQRRIRGR